MFYWVVPNLVSIKKLSNNSSTAMTAPSKDMPEKMVRHLHFSNHRESHIFGSAMRAVMLENRCQIPSSPKDIAFKLFRATKIVHKQ